jgi:hypothetical protein
VFYSWLRCKQHIKKSELHDLLQGRTFFYVYIDWTIWQKVPFVLTYFQASDALRPENSDSDGNDALFGVDTQITILQEKDFGLLTSYKYSY